VPVLGGRMRTPRWSSGLRRKLGLVVTLLTLCVLGPPLTSNLRSASSNTKRAPLLVGAYYSSWNPENLAQGNLRAHLVPSQQPPAALVNAANPSVAQRAIKLAKSAGISFFALDWWPLDGPPSIGQSELSKSDENVGAFLRARNLGRFKFCMFYETPALGFEADTESIPITPALVENFDHDMLSFAGRYFSNRSYLRVDGRPVVVLYLTRALTGDVAKMMHSARSALARRGINPFFIGDEMFWRVTSAEASSDTLDLTTVPQERRIKAFDAITAYTMYFGQPDPAMGIPGNVGYPGTTSIVQDERTLIDRYRAATHDQIPVLPDVSPGVNDRGVRLTVDHPAQPRQWLPGDGPASTLDRLFRHVAVPELDPRVPIIFITSWNEWNEDTGIQPIPGVSTTRDDSHSGDAYTEGYSYGGEGDSALVVLREDILVARRELLIKDLDITSRRGSSP
jgi:glycoprotein endo-alpha-1,2-mannosidase